jgi:hypothetical protein
MALGEDEETTNDGELRVDDVADGDEIVLRMPADARFARVARVAVSSLAVRLGFDVTVVEDLRIAVDEALIVLLRDDDGDGDGDGGQPPGDEAVVMTLRAGAPDLVVELRLDPRPEGRVARDADAERLSRFTELIPPRVVVHVVDLDHGLVRLGLR